MLTWSSNDTVTKLRGLKNIKKITIATAFISEYGINLLSEIARCNNISPANITLFLSMEFSDRNSAKILTTLCDIAQTYIVTKVKLHAKVFCFEGASNLLLTGSSNFTQGGFEHNLEMNVLDDVPNLDRIQEFFGRCMGLSSRVDDDVIEAYAATEPERQAARKHRNTLQDKLNTVLNSDDFGENTYPNIEQQYFVYRDYETLFKKNIKRRDPEIDRRRKDIQKKLLDINAIVQKPMQALGMAHHWSEAHTTSTIVPNEYNRERVEWCGIRYTRKETARYIQEMKLSGDGFGFQKYACLQFCIIPSGFEINLFHAVRNGAVDRDYFCNSILNMEFCADVESAIRNVHGHGFIWYAGENSFSIDEREPGEFIQWYKDNDKEGFETYLSYHFTPDNPVLKNQQTVADAFLKYAKILLPLFDIVSCRWGR